MTVTYLPATGQVHDYASQQNFEYIESHAVFDTALNWIGLPYQGNWLDNGTVQVGQYALDKLGWVHVRGVAKTSAGGYSFATPSTLIVANLPIGFRPGAQELFDVIQVDTGNNFNVIRFDVLANGNLVVNGGNTSPQETNSVNNGVPVYFSFKHIMFQQVN